MPHVIERLLDLMASTTTQKCSNLRYIYLAQFGADIIPFCAQRYSESSDAGFRGALMRFVIQYSRTDDRAVSLAISALSDRSQKVRHSACAVLAYSLKHAVIPPLEVLLTRPCSKTADDARRAIDCIKSGNHNRFYPVHDSWVVMPDDPVQPKRKSVDDYIVRLGPELIPQLEKIYGNIYQRWDETRKI